MTQTVILVGGPDTGKTNFLARLVAQLRDGQGALRAASLPEDMRYVEEALAHLMKGEFAPRSHNTTGEVSGEIAISVTSSGGEAAIVVPDVSGETWDEVARTAQISQAWLDRVQAASGSLLFVRVLSELNVSPMDWVNAPALLAFAGEGDERQLAVPTQVTLCELLRLLEENLSWSGDMLPRVGVVVTAWDRLDADTRSAGPVAFLAREYPLFAGKLANTTELEVGVFGASVVGGELADPGFRSRYLEGEFVESGYIVDGTSGPGETVGDISLPLAWVLRLPIA